MSPHQTKIDELGGRSEARAALPKRAASMPWCSALLLLSCTAGLAACSRLGLADPTAPGSSTGAQPLATEHPVIGLVSAVGGSSQALVEWRSQAPVDELPQFALFVSTDAAALFDGAPLLENPTGSRAVLTGLADESVLFVGLGIRNAPGDLYVASGPPLRVRTGAPLYVDPAAPPGGDGHTPATALDSVDAAILAAVQSPGAGGTVWVRGDVTIPDQSLTLYGGVYLAGGFDSNWTLDQRDPQAHPTRISGQFNHSVINIDPGTGTCAVDGFVLDGLSIATNGIRDESGLPIELRSLELLGCFRGIKLIADDAGPAIQVVVSGVHTHDNSAEGMEVEGPFELAINGSTFDLNAFEGLRLKYLVAPEHGSASLLLHGCDFQRNGRDGVECRMRQPLAAAHTAGHFDVRVQDCDFEQNADRGLVLNIDYDPYPEWDGDFLVQGCRFRANKNAGLDMHMDSKSTWLVERISSSANGTDGVSAKGVSVPVLCSLSASALFGNQGDAVNVVSGPAGIMLSHCVISGNLAGGLSSLSAPISAVSSVAWIQPLAWTNATPHDCVEQDAPDPEPFLNAAREFGLATSFDGTALSLLAAASATDGVLLELADDGTARHGVFQSATLLLPDPAPKSLLLPCTVAFFGGGPAVSEDLRLAIGSVATGAGMSAPGAPLVDAGIFGSPHGGEPGRGERVPGRSFFVASVAPSWVDTINPEDVLTVTFHGGELAPDSVSTSVFALDPSGKSLAIQPFADAGALAIAPPPGGWTSGTTIELQRGLRATNGTRIAAPVAFALRLP